jgi:hypothetical protein
MTLSANPSAMHAIRLDIVVMRHVEIDHLRVCRSPLASKLPEQVFPYAAPRPAHKAIIDRRRKTVFRRAIELAAAAFQHMYDAADDAAIVRPLNAPYIRRQTSFDPLPLLIA